MTTTEDRLREWIDRKAQQLEAGGVEHLKGDNWFQASPAEQEVFQLDPLNMARVIAVFDAYLEIADIAVKGSHGIPFCEEVRKAFPWIEQGRTAEDTFRRLAGLFGVSNRQASAFYWKHAFWEDRQGLVTYGG